MSLIRKGVLSAMVLGAGLMMAQPAMVAQQAAAPGTVVPAQTEGAPPLTKKQQKAQRKQQKAQEKAANQNAQAQKDQANALKHQDKATDAAQKAGQTTVPPQR